MTRIAVREMVFIACLSALPLMVGLTGCAGHRHKPSAGHPVDDNRRAGTGYNQITDQGIEDGRTAERVREALAAGVDYKYDGVKVIATNGVVQLSGFVITSAQRNNAGEIAGKVVGVKIVVNNLTVKD